MDTSNIAQVKAWLNKIAQYNACIDNIEGKDILVKIFDLDGNEIFMPGITLTTTDDIFGDNVTAFREAIITTLEEQIGILETNIAETPCEDEP